MQRFVLTTDTLTAEQEQSIKTALEQKGCLWWHWLPNLWLVVDASNQTSANGLRDIVQQVSLPASCLVLEVPPGYWALRISKDKIDASKGWLDSYWTR